MTNFFIYIFTALIVGQAVSIEYFKFLDIEEVQEVLQDLSEENDSSEQENEDEDHFYRFSQSWHVNNSRNTAVTDRMRAFDSFLELVCIEIPSPPPDLA